VVVAVSAAARLPWWIAEPLRIAIFMTPIVLAFYAWKHFQ